MNLRHLYFRLKLKQPGCGKCGYPVEGLAGDRCPECGGVFANVGVVQPWGSAESRLAIDLAKLAIVLAIVLAASNVLYESMVWRARGMQIAEVPLGRYTEDNQEVCVALLNIQTAIHHRKFTLPFAKAPSTPSKPDWICIDLRNPLSDPRLESDLYLVEQYAKRAGGKLNAESMADEQVARLLDTLDAEQLITPTEREQFEDQIRPAIEAAYCNELSAWAENAPLRQMLVPSPEGTSTRFYLNDARYFLRGAGYVRAEFVHDRPGQVSLAIIAAIAALRLRFCWRRYKSQRDAVDAEHFADNA